MSVKIVLDRLFYLSFTLRPIFRDRIISSEVRMKILNFREEYIHIFFYQKFRLESARLTLVSRVRNLEGVFEKVIL